MADKGVPLEYIRWLYGFLQNRQATVRLHGASSSPKCCVTQGCVLSPLLFVFFINNVVDRLMLEDPVRAQQLVISLFADDITVLAQHSKREIATAEAQWAVDVIANWSKEWKLELNATKSEVTFFSTWTHEANFQPSISIANKVVPYKKTPKLLGVRYDWNLSFTAHVEEVSKAVSGKLGMLASVGNSHWGWDKHHLGQL